VKKPPKRGPSSREKNGNPKIGVKLKFEEHWESPPIPGRTQVIKKEPKGESKPHSSGQEVRYRYRST